MKNLILAFALLFGVLAAAEVRAAPCATYPFTLTNGQTADANQVMANFNAILNCANTNLATAGTNSNITALTGLTTPLSVSQGGTGATTLSGIEAALGGPFLVAANNLSDVASTTTALTNLGAAPLNSPGLTGTPTAPTAAGGTNTTQIATTAFVQSALAATTYAEFRNQQTSGTGSGETISTGTWTARVLNTTVVNTIPGASLSGNQVSLPAGTYVATASGSGTTSGSGVAITMKLRVRNITASSTLVSGQNIFVAAPSALNGGLAVLQGQFTLGSTSTIELDEWTVLSAGTINGGSISSSGDPEVYDQIYLQKIG